MISVLNLITFSSLFVGGFTQYYPYPYNYGGNTQLTYPVSTQPNYGYRPSPCRSSCNSCQYLPCYAQKPYAQQSYAQQVYAQQPYIQQPFAQQAYYQPYNYYNSRQYANPYINFYGNSRKSPDPYANIPTEIIDDHSVIRQNLPYYNSNVQDKYANVPVEIIDDDGSTVDFWKNIPVLPKSKTTSSSNYTVTRGEVTSNTQTRSNPIQATISRTFQPLKRTPDVKINFLGGAVLNNTANQNKISEEETNEISESVTIASDEEATTEANKVLENEEVKPVSNWLF